MEGEEGGNSQKNLGGNGRVGWGGGEVCVGG